MILAVAAITYATENFLRASPSALSPIISAELGLSYTDIGFLFSSHFFLYGLMQLPSGMLSDRLGPRKTIIGFTVFMIAGTLIFSQSTSYTTLLIAQLLTGLGSSVFYINAVKIVSGWFPLNVRASAIGVLSASSGLGNFAAYITLPLVMEYMGGWRTAYVYCAGLMVVNFIVNILALKENPRDNDTVETSRIGLLDSVKAVLGNRSLYPLMIGYILLSFFWVFSSWLPQFLTDRYGLSYVDVGFISSARTLTAIPGCILVGVISDRLKKRKLPLVTLAAVSTVIMSLFLVLPVGVPPMVLIVLAGLLGFSMSLWVLFFSIIPEILPQNVTGIGLGLVNGIGTIGFSLVSPIYGNLIDQTGSFFTSNMILLAAGVSMTAIFFLFLGETYGNRVEN